MTLLAIGASRTLVLGDNGYLNVASNGGFWSLLGVPNVGLPVSLSFGPLPSRRRTGVSKEGVTYTITNSSCNTLDYDYYSGDGGLTQDQVAATQALVSGPGKKPCAALGYYSRSSNYAYVNANASATTPTPIQPNTASSWGVPEFYIPAQIGDIIEFEFNGRVNTDAASGLVLSLWSCGGSVMKDVSSTARTLQSVAGFLTIAAASTAVLSKSVFFTVKAEDIDDNGYVKLRMYGANSSGTAASRTHTFVGYGGNGVVCYMMLMNHRKNAAGQYQVTTVYPGGVKGGTLSVTTTGGAYGSVTPFDSGASDIVFAATALDVVRFQARFGITTNGAAGVRATLVIVKNGAAFRIANTGVTPVDVNGPVSDSVGGTAPVVINSAFRVRDTDISSDGKVYLRLNLTATGSTGSLAHTILGTDTNGGASYWRAVNMGSGWRYVLLPSIASFEGGTDAEVASLQEPAWWFDGSKHNILYSCPKTGNVGWATAPALKGPWTKYSSKVLGNGLGVTGNFGRGSVLYENGILYYYGNAGAARIECFYGPSPMTWVKVTAGALTGFPTGSNTVENTSVKKGPDGNYWMWVEVLNTAATNWQMSLAKATSPQGPFTYVTGAEVLTSLQQIAGGTTNGPDAEWTGAYWRMIHHASPIAPSVVPSIPYFETSVDGQTWAHKAIGADGLPNGLLMPLLCVDHNQAADPAIATDSTGTYVFMSSNITSTFDKGGIIVNDPDAWPISFAI